MGEEHRLPALGFIFAFLTTTTSGRTPCRPGSPGCDCPRVPLSAGQGRRSPHPPDPPARTHSPRSAAAAEGLGLQRETALAGAGGGAGA